MPNWRKVVKIKDIGGFKRAGEYINYKLGMLESSDKSMSSLYKLMFSERENIMFEQSDGFRIKKTSYGEIFDCIEAICADLQRKINADRQSIVGIYMDNSPQWVVAFWAVLHCGFKPLLLNLRLSDAIIERVIVQNNVCAVISDGKIFSVNTIFFDNVEKSEALIEKCEFGREFFVMSSGTSSVKLCAYSADELVQIIRDSSDLLKRNPIPKRHYNGNIKLLAFLPFYHIFGFVAVYLWFSFFARTFVCLRDYGPQTIVNTIKKHKVTHIFAVPMLWDKVYEQAISTIKSRGLKDKFDKALQISNKLGNSLAGKVFASLAFKEVREKTFGESVRFLITGGSIIRPQVIGFFNGIGYHLANGYGMSEVGITSVELSNSRKKLNSCSIGKPLPSIEYKIDENGILEIRGKSLAKYICENGEKRYTNGDWFNTHDLCQKKGDCYYLNGREDDLIVSVSGENINPVAVEEVLLPKNANVVCLIAGKDSELPVLLTSVQKGLSREEAESVVKEIRKRMDENNLSAQIGKIYLTCDELITGNEFKLNRKRLKKDYLEGKISRIEFENDDVSGKRDELQEKIRGYFAIVLGKTEEQVGYETNFFLDEGGTSLDYFALIAKLQQDFRIDFPMSVDENLTTVAGMAEYIRERI